MRSKESQVAEQVRLKQWALEVQKCLNRPIVEIDNPPKAM